MGNTFSMEAPQLDPELVAYSDGTNPPPFSRGLAFAAGDMNSFGFLATVTEVRYYDPLTVTANLPVRDGTTTIVTCSMPSASTSQDSESITYTGSMLCPYANGLIGQGTVTIGAVRVPSDHDFTNYGFYAGLTTVVETTSTIFPAVTVPSATTTTTTTPEATVTSTSTVTIFQVVTPTDSTSSTSDSITTSTTGRSSTGSMTITTESTNILPTLRKPCGTKKRRTVAVFEPFPGYGPPTSHVALVTSTSTVIAVAPETVTVHEGEATETSTAPTDTKTIFETITYTVLVFSTAGAASPTTNETGEAVSVTDTLTSFVETRYKSRSSTIGGSVSADGTLTSSQAMVSSVTSTITGKDSG